MRSSADGYVDPTPFTQSVSAFRVRPPIGDIYLASIDHRLLQKITYFDIRRVLRDQRDVEACLGIQRPINETRLKELQKYVNFADATFPTTVILAIEESDYIQYDENNNRMTLSNTRVGNTEPDIAISNLCRVLDGQHRIAGLETFEGQNFDVMAAIFVGIDIADQAYIFATVNLEQTKVSRSLAYDLFELAKTRSPYKTCHNVAVALDSVETSPLYKRIKKLGTATLGRERETITQATFVESLMRYISNNPKSDRDILLRHQSLNLVDSEMSQRFCFRNIFIRGDDLLIGRIVQTYFEAVRSRWPQAWDDFGQGSILNKTNGFRALMAVFGQIYTYIAPPGDFVSRVRFEEMFEKCVLQDRDFNVENYPPGTSGEVKLRNDLRAQIFDA